MKEPHIEGVATHGDPESCVGAREGAGEALTGARAGWVLSREINLTRVPTWSNNTEGNTNGGVTASPCSALRGRRPHARSETPCARTGSSPDRLSRMVRRAAPGRPEAVCR
jgi:RNA-directed DNA polymerase